MLAQSSGELRVVARLYIAAVVIAASGLVAYYLRNPDLGRPGTDAGTFELAGAALVGVAIAFLSEMRPVVIPSTRMFDEGADEWSVSSAVHIAGLLLYGPLFPIFTASISVFLSDLLRRKSPSRLAFNTGQYVLTIAASGLILVHTMGSNRTLHDMVASPAALAILTLTLTSYFLFNVSLVAVAVALVDRAPFLPVLRSLVRLSAVQYSGMLVLGLIAAILWSVGPFALVLLVPPILVVHLAVKSVAQLKSETGQALLAIAEMVDARDAYAYAHSREVARYATRVATALGLPSEEVATIKMAAQLHDIGKMGTPDRVLHKPGPLDPEERRIMEGHSAAGAHVLSYFSLFRDGADLALYHHEHYDGTGYPKGLVGKQIPLGARILHVVDAFQAMTSDRVYRKAMSEEAAVSQLLAGSGKQFDPDVVRAFLQVLKWPLAVPAEVPAPDKRAIVMEGEGEPSLAAGRS
jgi:putative nucleotidyltransferase with HDIG domain